MMICKIHKGLVLLVLSLLLKTAVFSQEFIQSPTFKSYAKYSNFDILGENDFGILVHYFSTTDHLIEIFNSNLRPLYKKEIIMPGKRDFIEEIIAFDNHIGVFYTNNDSRNVYLNYTKYNSKLNPYGTSMVLDSIRGTAIEGNLKYYVKTSEDQSKIIVFYFTYRGNNWTFTYKLFDRDFNLIGQGNILNEARGNKLPKSVRVSNNGSILCILAHYGPRADSDNAHNTERLSIYTRELSAPYFSNKEIYNENFLMKGIMTRIDEKSDVVYLSGGYVDRRNGARIGLFTSIFDFKDGFIHDFNEIPFSSEEVMMGTGVNFRKWEEKAIIIEPRRLVVRSDGGVILISESEYKYLQVVRNPVSTFNPYGMNNYYTTYYDKNYFYDIWVTSVNPDGSVDWRKTLRKSQETQTDDGKYSSFSFFEANNALKFLFNEDIYANGNFIEFDVTPNGYSKRLSLFNTQKLSTTLIPQKAKQISGNRIIIPGERKKNLQFIMLKY
jgi:hypothetical protein